MLVVILGKAMLLAKGREITDPTILGQLANWPTVIAGL